MDTERGSITFQSTSLSRGKTPPARCPVRWIELSIHFPLTREDFTPFGSQVMSRFFQSTSLSRGKTGLKIEIDSSDAFQSTSLSRGKTDLKCMKSLREAFQSTSLSRGKTAPGRFPDVRQIFQSTSLSRGKTPILIPVIFVPGLSIHFPLTREDITVYGPPEDEIFFQSTSLSRGKTSKARTMLSCR